MLPVIGTWRPSGKDVIDGLGGWPKSASNVMFAVKRMTELATRVGRQEAGQA